MSWQIAGKKKRKKEQVIIIDMVIIFQGQMIMQDRLEKERADAKNSVEEYVYDMRDKLGNEYERYMKEEVSWELVAYHF